MKNYSNLKYLLIKRWIVIDSFKRNTSTILSEQYNFGLAKEIEKKWINQLDSIHKSYCENDLIKTTKEKKYILSMFPYPSGRLHLGHVRVYTISDILARYYRMRGYYVIHPIGWDSFGLPAENAANERKIRADIWTKSNIEFMKNQLKSMSFSFDWNRELSTCDKSYYKWTQWLFLELYKNGVVNQKEALVNWDPIDKTVLANEQIDSDGNSWRSGAKVEKKILKQWFIKSSVYAKSLCDSLETLNSNDWDNIKKIQKMWIGQCDGCFIDFKLKLKDKNLYDLVLPVFTKEPYAIYGISHITISKSNIILNHLNSFKENSFISCNAINPFNGETIPIYLKSDEDFGELNANGESYLDAKLGIPSLNENDRNFALKNNLKFKEIFENDKNSLINSNELNNLNKTEAFDLVSKKLKEINQGGHQTSLKLNDWCISRQRIWGTPIPLIYCKNCGVVPIDESKLPFELHSKLLSNQKDSNLESNEHLFETKCPKCNGDAKLEKDTMDTFVDSSWYYFRYLDVNNTKEPFDLDLVAKQMPVDIYIGGAEHAMTHLFVSRLITHFLFDKNKIKFKEPFTRFLAMGMIKGETFKTKNGKYIQPDLVDIRDNKFYLKTTNEELVKDFEKMSKSKLNGIDPEFMIEKYGIDFTRLFLINFVHPKSDRNFSLSQDMIDGNKNIFERLWKLVVKINKTEKPNKRPINNKSDNELEKLKNELYKIRNSQLSMIAYNLNENFNLPSYIVAASKIIKFLNKYPESYYNEKFYDLLAESLIVLAPVIPHFTSECWNILKLNLDLKKFDKSKSILEQSWPLIDDDWKIELILRIDGVRRCSIYLNKSEIDVLKKDEAIKLLRNKIGQNSDLNNKFESHKSYLESNLPLNLVLSLKK